MTDEGRSFAEMLVSFMDELDIEEELLALESDDDCAEEFVAPYRQALIRIDELRREGRYDSERQALSRRYPSVTTALNHLSDTVKNADPEFVGALDNFFAGLRSPDAAQRAKFQRAKEMSGMGNALPRDFRHILEIAERAKSPGGRPSVSPPWRNVNQQLLQMAQLVWAGSSVPRAAWAVCGDSAGADNRAERLAKLYRQKMAMREVPE